MKHRIEITYCTQCRWLMRAAWMPQQLFTDDAVQETLLVESPDHDVVPRHG